MNLTYIALTHACGFAPADRMRDDGREAMEFLTQYFWKSADLPPTQLVDKVKGIHKSCFVWIKEEMCNN